MKKYIIKIIIHRPDARGFNPTVEATVTVKTDCEQKAMNIAESYPFFKEFAT